MAIDLRRLGLDKASYGDGLSDSYAVIASNNQYKDALIDVTNTNQQQQRLIDNVMIDAHRANRQGLLSFADKPKSKTANAGGRAGLRQLRYSVDRYQYQRPKAGRG